MERIWRGAGLDKEKETPVFYFELIMFEVPIGIPSGNVKQAIEYMILELRTEVAFQT